MPTILHMSPHRGYVNLSARLSPIDILFRHNRLVPIPFRLSRSPDKSGLRNEDSPGLGTDDLSEPALGTESRWNRGGLRSIEGIPIFRGFKTGVRGSVLDWQGDLA